MIKPFSTPMACSGHLSKQNPMSLMLYLFRGQGIPENPKQPRVHTIFLPSIFLIENTSRPGQK